MTKRTFPNLTIYLEQTGQSQVDLAVRLQRSQAYISKLVNGLQQPSLHEALRIARVCRVPVESLVTRESALPSSK